MTTWGNPVPGGIGKTTLWTYAVRRARDRGFRVLECRLGEPESGLPFAGSPDALTPAERRVVDVVEAGHTNDEVAAALFLSRRTVEAPPVAHLPQGGVRSRTELARAAANS
jgi:DNA-binding NarL/FixJ family response regulator